MKIKLNRDLWNHKTGDEIEVGEDRGTWAVNKGYAVDVESAPAQNKAIEPKYKRNKLK